MNRTNSIIFIIFFCLTTNPLWATDPHVEELEKKPVPEFKSIPIQTHTFDNGIKLYFLENRELPIFEISAFFKVGTIYEPADKKGLTYLMMSSLRTGGSKGRSADEVDELLEEAAAALSASVNREYSTLTLQVTTKDIADILPLFFELIQSPGFDFKKLELSREQMLEGIRRRNDSPMPITKRKFLQHLYGKENVWARISTIDTVRSITRDEVIDYYKRFISPKNIRIVVSGDISFEKITAKLKPMVTKLKPFDVTYPKIEEVEKKWVPTIYYIPKIANQSAIILGHFGEKRFNPDKYALILANYILGGSTFGSRLGKTIRNNLGLAYSIYSHFGFDTDYGDFRVMVSTKSSSTIEVVKEAKRILKDLQRRDPVSEEELQNAKQSILNTMIFQNEDPFRYVERQLWYDFYGYPPDYLSIYQKEIKKVTLKEVQQAFKKYFHPSRLIVMIVGNPEQMGRVSRLGRVKVLPLDLE